jgi:hypothetical protein
MPEKAERVQHSSLLCLCVVVGTFMSSFLVTGARERQATKDGASLPGSLVFLAFPFQHLAQTATWRLSTTQSGTW